jgi:hypothetical protein
MIKNAVETIIVERCLVLTALALYAIKESANSLSSTGPILGFCNDSSVNVDIGRCKLNHGKSGGALLALMNKSVSKFLIKKDAAKSRLESCRIVGLNEKCVNFVGGDVHVAVKGACHYWCGCGHCLNKNDAEALST